MKKYTFSHTIHIFPDFFKIVTIPDDCLRRPMQVLVLWDDRAKALAADLELGV